MGIWGVYRILSSKCPWALAIDGQITGVGAYRDKKPFVCITHIYVNHRIIKKGGVGAYTKMCAYSREYGNTK